MKVSLINATHDAEELLITSKNTRLLNASAPYELDDEEKAEQLKYIAGTIKSSWEFIDYTFLIEDVSRAFTHQFVRNRQGSYAQQTMRMLDVGGFTYHTGPSIEGNTKAEEIYHDTMATVDAAYKELIQLGIPAEDARGVLPTNIHTNIMVKYNLRTLSDLFSSRSSPRTQGEFRSVIEAMYEAVVGKHPWTEQFLKNQKTEAASNLDEFIDSIGVAFCPKGNEIEVNKLNLIKKVDVLRR